MANSSNSRRQKANQLRNSSDIGVSFSIKTCADYGISWQDCLDELIRVGIKRFRLMSYWDLHEPSMGNMDFRSLDEQVARIESAGGRISFCLGIRQPRWPESHVPRWAIGLDEERRGAFYITFLRAVVERYRDRSCIESWQLENEFWNKNFGINNTFSRERLIHEFDTLRLLDESRPIIMSLGNTTGFPIGKPRPDLFASTLYLIQFEKGKYRKTLYRPWYFRARRTLVHLFTGKDMLFHEVQAEPWGPRANWEMDEHEQAKSMNAEQLQKVIKFAKSTGIKYIDLWGGEWWYWRKVTRGDSSLLDVISTLEK